MSCEYHAEREGLQGNECYLAVKQQSLTMNWPYGQKYYGTVDIDNMQWSLPCSST
jgi:hypothetical protein